MEKKSLESLPDELVLDIVEHFDTAQDVAHLGISARRQHDIIKRNGWKTFVKTQFPSLMIPSDGRTEWSRVADRLTYVDQCWEKRGFWMNVFSEKKQQHGRFQRRPMGSQSVSFHSLLDSCCSSSLDDEVLAAGAGENLLLRLKPQSGRSRPQTWYSFEGKHHGYSAGTGDITAVSVINRGTWPEVVVGRANGDIQVVSVEDGLRQTQQSLVPVGDGESQPHGMLDPRKKSPGQLAVSWTEWQPQSQLLASCQGSVLRLHELADGEAKAVHPSDHYDFSRDCANDEASLLRSTKFLNKDTIVCALGGSREPLRWGKVTPSGVVLDSPRNLNSADPSLTLDGILKAKTTVRAIEPVRGAGSESLILSAWDDGTYRLSDIRSPSPHESVYCDQFQPYEAGSSLLLYGTERFVAGSNIAPHIRFFDFRYPKLYHYTSAYPCSTDHPIPAPKTFHVKSDDKVRTCSFQDGKVCNYHDLARQDPFRPDATILIGNQSYERIHCLTKASDMSTSVFCGVRGAFIEMNLTLTNEESPDQTVPTAPPGWRMGRPGGKISLIETGVNLCQSPYWSAENCGMPTLLPQRPPPVSGRKATYRPDTCRLDAGYVLPEMILTDRREHQR